MESYAHTHPAGIGPYPSPSPFVSLSLPLSTGAGPPLTRSGAGPPPSQILWVSVDGMALSLIRRMGPLRGRCAEMWEGEVWLLDHKNVIAPRACARCGGLRRGAYNAISCAGDGHGGKVMTDLSIALDGPRTSGRSSKPVLAELVRELNAADLCLLDLDRGTKPPSLKRLRDHHHRIARLFAEGKRNSEIGMLTGLSQSRISIYRSDPAMMELVEHYSRIVEETLDEAFQHGVEQLSTLRRAAAEELTERLEESPEKFNEEDLMDLLKLTADRTGLGPQTKSTTLNVNMNLADRIAAGRSRAAEAARLITSSPEHETLIEGSVCPSPDALPSPAGGGQ